MYRAGDRSSDLLTVARRGPSQTKPITPSQERYLMVAACWPSCQQFHTVYPVFACIGTDCFTLKLDPAV